MTLPPIQPAKLWVFRETGFLRSSPEDYWHLACFPTSRYQIRFSLGYYGSLINVKHELNQPQQSREQTTLQLLWHVRYPNGHETVILIPYSSGRPYVLTQSLPISPKFYTRESTSIEIDEGLIREKKDLINWFWTTNSLPRTMEEFPI